MLGELFFYRTCRGKLVNTVVSVFPLMQAGQVAGAICFIKDYNLLDKNLAVTSVCSPYEGHGYGNGTRFTFSDIIGDDEKFLQSVKMARLTADSPSPIVRKSPPYSHRRHSSKNYVLTAYSSSNSSFI